MALVLLPCDLPSWPTVQRLLIQLKQVQSSAQLVEGMQKLYSLCCVGLDPDDEIPDVHRFDGLQRFIDEVLIEVERSRFFDTVLPCMISCALKLKLLKPENGLHFSLQQQADQVSLDRRFILALVANAFFSTFPKRTLKTHPTLQDFNFCDFFSHLNSLEQQLKLRCLLQYFDIAASREPHGHITIARSLTPKWNLRALNDWLECSSPLCPLIIRHEGTIEDADEGTYQVCFASPRIGGNALLDGCNQEELMFFKNPELLVIMLYVESLEDNEALSAHNWMNIGHVGENKKFSPAEKFSNLSDTHLCAIDALSFRGNPEKQYEDHLLLRELCKAYLGFQQQKSLARLSPLGDSCSSTPPERQSSTSHSSESQSHQPLPTYTHCKVTAQETEVLTLAKLCKETLDSCSDWVDDQSHTDGRRLVQKFCTQELPPTKTVLKTSPPTVSHHEALLEKGNTCPKKGVDSIQLAEKLSKLTLPELSKIQKQNISEASEENYHNALSTQSSYCSAIEDEIWYTPMEPPFSPSMSECRPLFCNKAEKPPAPAATSSSRKRTISLKTKSYESDLSEDEDEYQSCAEELENESNDVRTTHHLGPDLVSSRGRWLFAESLKGAIRNSSQQSDVEDSGCSLDIHIEGPDVRDREGICVRRVPSTGFLLDEDQFFGDSLEAEQTWLRQFRHRSTSRSVSRRNSSRYSFSSDFSSDLGDIYEHFEEMMAADPISQDPATAQFVGGMLKRTLSDSFTATASRRNTVLDREIAMPRSLSLADHLTQERLAMETAKQQALSSTPVQKSAAESPNGMSETSSGTRKLSGRLDFKLDGYRPIATGNWGCGQLRGDSQLKAIIQWLAASRCGIPCLLYFTANNSSVVKLDTVGRVLVDRQWSVGTLMNVVLDYCHSKKNEEKDNATPTLFDKILPKDIH